MGACSQSMGSMCILGALQFVSWGFCVALRREWLEWQASVEHILISSDQKFEACEDKHSKELHD